MLSFFIIFGKLYLFTPTFIIELKLKKIIEKYIRNQLQEDMASEQNDKEYIDPFTDDKKAKT